MIPQPSLSVSHSRSSFNEPSGKVRSANRRRASAFGICARHPWANRGSLVSPGHPRTLASFAVPAPTYRRIPTMVVERCCRLPHPTTPMLIHLQVQKSIVSTRADTVQTSTRRQDHLRDPSRGCAHLVERNVNSQLSYVRLRAFTILESSRYWQMMLPRLRRPRRRCPYTAPPGRR